MANDLIRKQFKDIANSIRAKTGKNGTIKADEMSAEIDSIHVGIEPEGTKEIRANGEYNIREFENVNIDVPGATTKDLFEATANGTYDIAEYANVKVDVPNPSSGTLDITTNGNYDVTEKAGVNVNVPNPSTGTKNIVENGNYDVTEFANANVNIPAPTYHSNVYYPTDNDGEIQEEREFEPGTDNAWYFGESVEFDDPTMLDRYYIDSGQPIIIEDARIWTDNYNGISTPHCQSIYGGGIYESWNVDTDIYTDTDSDVFSQVSTRTAQGVLLSPYHFEYIAGYGSDQIEELTAGWYLIHNNEYLSPSKESFQQLEVNQSVTVYIDGQTFTITRTE